jgi:type IV secretion system protein VirD4
VEILSLIQLAMKLGLTSLGILLAAKLRQDRVRLATAEIGTDLKGYEGTTGLKLSTNKRLSEKASQEHIIIIAPTGAGKTTSLYIPNLLEDNLKGSLIIADPKGELYKLTHKYQESIGRKTILYKPLEGKIEYNPLKECKTNSEVYQLAQNLLINGALSIELQTGKKSGGVEWLQMAQSLLTAALLYSDTIQNALKLIINNTTETLDQIFNDCENEAIQTQYNAFKMCLDSPKTMASIKITISSSLQLFLDDLRINKSSFSAETLREQPTALYISYPENKANYLAPLMACIYSQLIDKLIDSYNDAAIPIHFLVDEWANQGQWSNMSQNISTSRSRKVSFVLCVQSISQIKQIYGQDIALSILNNCKTKIILPGLSDISTLEYISKLCGEEEILVQQEGRKVKTKKLLFTIDEIRRLKDDELLIISKNFRPIIEAQNAWYNQEVYKERVSRKP